MGKEIPVFKLSGNGSIYDGMFAPVTAAAFNTLFNKRYRMQFLKSLAVVSAFSLITPAYAQQKFTEGTIEYTISINGPAPTDYSNPGLSKAGTLLFSIKDNNVRQDLKLEDGYTYSRIGNFTTEKDIILQTLNTINYAIETDLKSLKAKAGAYYGAKLETTGNTRKVNDLEAQEALLKYKDGTSMRFFYHKDYELPHPEIFERMPELKGIPALFDVPMSNGYVTHFELRRITPGPVGNTIFRVPEGYRIISKKEYDKLTN
ncbi:hypothetical protein B0I18_112157 [Taibaiella chishuiensis]|uniref:GLPGLI family protein n=2 Tax=Taibaiella chishuiensis TaxID=1434707 RepID=A0A2P8CWM1_9BACT|nr:hypothetical protein B0I18_112157 [Taibaiella chishuiensis]